MSSNRQAAASSPWREPVLFAILAALFVLEGTVRNSMFSGSWNTSLAILNMGLLSAITALGVNMQWGYAGLFNVGVVGFLAMGALAPVLVSLPPVEGAWAAGGTRLMLALAVGVGTLAMAKLAWTRTRSGILTAVVLIGGFVAYRWLFDPAVIAIEANNPARNGNIGGLGLPVLLSWVVGGLFAAAAAWALGRPTWSMRYRGWRCRFVSSTRSGSTSVIRPTPAAARYCSAGQPSPPAPTTSTWACASRSCPAAPMPGSTIWRA